MPDGHGRRPPRSRRRGCVPTRRGRVAPGPVPGRGRHAPGRSRARSGRDVSTVGSPRRCSGVSFESGASHAPSSPSPSDGGASGAPGVVDWPSIAPGTTRAGRPRRCRGGGPVGRQLPERLATRRDHSAGVPPLVVDLGHGDLDHALPEGLVPDRPVPDVFETLVGLEEAFLLPPAHPPLQGVLDTSRVRSRR